MDEQLGNEFREFISRLQAARDACERSEHLPAYSDAIDLATRITDQQDFAIAEFERLKRIVSDSLPWSDDVLQTWNRITRLVRLSYS